MKPISDSLGGRSPKSRKPGTVDDLLDKRLIMISGKGGVGKTTFAAALAVRAARRNRRVLLAQMNSPRGLGQLLGCEEPKPEAKSAKGIEGLSIVNLDPQRAVEQFGSLRLKHKALMRTLLHNRAVKFFIRAIPGLDALSLMGRTWYYTIEENGDGEYRFQTVILETPGLGHLVRLLRLPEIVLDAVPDGPLRNDAHQIASLIRDPQRCSVVVVTLAEELPVRETIELQASLVDADYRIALTVVNGLYPSVLTENPLLERFAAMDKDRFDDPAIGELSRKARLFHNRRAMNETWLAELLASLKSPSLLLPRFFVPALGSDEVRALADWIGRPEAEVLSSGAGSGG